MDGIELAQAREVRLGIGGRLTEAPVHHADLEEDALLGLGLEPTAQRIVVELDEVVPALLRHEVLDEVRHALGVAGRERHDLVVDRRGAVLLLELARQHARRLQEEREAILALLRLLRRLEQDRREVVPLLAQRQRVCVETGRARVARVSLERLLEDAIGVLLAPALLVLPHQRARAHEQRALERCIVCRIGLVDEALRDLLPVPFGSDDLLDRFLDRLVAGSEGQRGLEARLRRLVVEQLLALEATGLHEERRTRVGITRLALELGDLGQQEAHGRDVLRPQLVLLARELHETERRITGARGVAARERVPKIAHDLRVVRILLQGAEQMGNSEHADSSPWLGS